MQLKCSCGKILKVPDSMAGKNGKCPGCGKVFKVPVPKHAAPRSAPAPRPAAGRIVVQCTCGKKLAAPASAAGKKVRCPACQNILSVPSSAAAPPPPPPKPETGEDELGFAADAFETEPAPSPAPASDGDYGVAEARCPNCGAQLEDGARICVQCGANLAGGAKASPAKAGDAAGSKSRGRKKLVIILCVVLGALILLGGGGYALYAFVVKPKLLDVMPVPEQELEKGMKQEPKPAAGAESGGEAAPGKEKPGDQQPGDKKPEPGEKPPATPAKRDEKTPALGPPPDKKGDEGYLENVVYAPGRFRKKTTILGMQQAVQGFQATHGRLPKSLAELSQEYPSIPRPPHGTSYDYDPKTGKIDIKRLRDLKAQSAARKAPELD